jgi:hypothetical protein
VRRVRQPSRHAAARQPALDVRPGIHPRSPFSPACSC